MVMSLLKQGTPINTSACPILSMRLRTGWRIAVLNRIILSNPFSNESNPCVS